MPWHAPCKKICQWILSRAAAAEVMVIDLDSYLLRAFLMVLETGAINRAASSLNRTQAAVSMQIRKLEGLVGAELFERSPRGLVPTSSGRLLAGYAREILFLSDEIEQKFTGQCLEGQIRIGLVEDFAATRMIGVLRALRDQHTRATLDIVVLPNRQLHEQLDTGKLDVAICDTTCTDRPPLLRWSERLNWVVRADMHLPPDRPLPIVMFDQACVWRNAAISILAECRAPWTIVAEAGNLTAMATAVRVGVGIAPMLAETIPPDCRVLDSASPLSCPVQVDMGLFSRQSERARFASEFIRRHWELTTQPFLRPDLLHHPDHAQLN